MAERLGQDEVRRALAEDRATDDVTSRLLGPAVDRPAVVRFVAEQRLVVAGMPVAALVFKELSADAAFRSLISDGAWADGGATIAKVRAPAGTLLSGERVALNFLQHLSGIATLTRRAVDAVAGTGARVTHTRKTTPGLRALERYAVMQGGGVENRGSLADAVLWKDNHWALLGAAPVTVTLAEALNAAPPNTSIIVEVEDEAQFEQALATGVRHILVDNQPAGRVAAWVVRAGPGVTIQASGGITPETARTYAEAGAALISIGALTHSAPAVGIRCDIAFT